MIHNRVVAGVDDVDLADRVARLARLVRCAPRFADALSWWAGFPVRRQPRLPDQAQVLRARDARLLDLPSATPVTRRDGYLVSAIGSGGFRVGAVVALVHEPGLGLDLRGQGLLRAGTVPVTQLVLDCQRATHYAYRATAAGVDEQVALRSRATLLLAGQPVALVWETVFWRLLRHRNPTALPVPPRIAPSVVSTR